MTLISADAWFAEIADALRRGDLNHPDVEFFLTKKIEEWVSERETPRENEQPLAV